MRGEELPFLELNPGPQPAGDCGGELQTTEAFCRRWVKPAPGANAAEWLSVTVEFWGEAQDEWSCVSERFEFIRCTDPADPGSTEIWANYSDINYVRGAEVTDQGVRKVCADFEWPADFDWSLESGEPT